MEIPRKPEHRVATYFNGVYGSFSHMRLRRNEKIPNYFSKCSEVLNWWDRTYTSSIGSHRVEVGFEFRIIPFEYMPLIKQMAYAFNCIVITRQRLTQQQQYHQYLEIFGPNEKAAKDLQWAYHDLINILQKHRRWLSHHKKKINKPRQDEYRRKGITHNLTHARKYASRKWLEQIAHFTEVFKEFTRKDQTTLNHVKEAVFRKITLDYRMNLYNIELKNGREPKLILAKLPKIRFKPNKVVNP